jgi:hypothetical protein
MSAKFHLLTDAGPGLPQLTLVAFDLAGVIKPPLVYASQIYNSTCSSRLAPDAVVRALNHPGQLVAGIHDPHSLEFC